MVVAEVGEVERLEGLWLSKFGDDYTDRNRGERPGRLKFWQSIVDVCQPRRVLEVGCGDGKNLDLLSRNCQVLDLSGVDINPYALFLCGRYRANTHWCSAKDLPYRDGWFDLVFTAGVLIHQPASGLGAVMDEVVRCSRRWVLAVEYYAPEEVEVEWRGQRGALWKRDYGGLYVARYPELELVRMGYLGKDEGWDDCTYWLFRKRG